MATTPVRVFSFQPPSTVALVTDSPLLSQTGMYLDELVKGLPRKGIRPVVRFVPSRLLRRRLHLERIVRGRLLRRRMAAYDVVHVQYTFPLGWAMTSRAKRDPPVVVHTHGFDVFALPEVGYGLRRLPWGTAVCRTTWRRASVVLAVCASSGREVRSVAPEANVVVVPNGVDPDVFRPGREPHPRLRPRLDGGGTLVLHTGYLTPVKNQRRLLRAFAKARDAVPSCRPHLVMAGDGPLRRTLMDDAVRLGLGDAVTFLGTVPRAEMPGVYAAADLFVLPSLSEAHPWSLLEAMAAGLPVVAAHVGGIPDTLDPSQLVNPWDDASIAEGLTRFLQDEGERRDAGRRNRRTVEGRFTLRHHIDGIAEAYARALGG
jgi:glycosyltransferase involved in cell wall biosynthesis